MHAQAERTSSKIVEHSIKMQSISLSLNVFSITFNFTFLKSSVLCDDSATE